MSRAFNESMFGAGESTNAEIVAAIESLACRVGLTTPAAGAFTTMSASTGAAVGGASAGTGGVAFPATAVDVADPNTLDDYEEGTFTITDDSGASLALIGGAGIYTKVGRIVSFAVNVTFPATADASSVKLTGIPFAPSAVQVLEHLGNTALDLIYAVDPSVLTITPYITATEFTRPTNAQFSGKIMYLSGKYLV